MPALGALLSTPAPEAASRREMPDSAAVPSEKLARRRPITPLDVAITAVFGLILLVQIGRHDMWRDEIHSWGLVLASPTLPDLFHSLRFTGHPALWYLPLWTASHFTASPYTVQVVHAVIALSLIGAIGLFSPFSRLERLLLLASYFVLYEYTVISRNYGIGFLIALIYAEMRATRPDRVYLNACLLGLLANTNMFAFILSGAFAFEYAVELLFRRGRGDFRRAFMAALPPALVYLTFAVAAVATMWPSPDISWRTTGQPLAQAFDPVRLMAMITGNVTALLPTHPLNYWRAKADGILHPPDAFALPALAFIFFYIFRKNTQLLLIPGLTFLGSVAVGQLIYANSIRHWGISFVAFVATLWIYRVANRERSYFALGLLAISAAAGVAISVQQFSWTFSEGRHTAEWIRKNGFADDALIGLPDTYGVVIAQYLGKPMYFLECSCTDTYLFYHKRRDAYNPRQMPERLARAVGELAGRPILFIDAHPLTDAELADIRSRGVAVTQLAAFDQASTDENFYVYRVGRTAPGASTSPGSS